MKRSWHLKSSPKLSISLQAVGAKQGQKISRKIVTKNGQEDKDKSCQKYNKKCHLYKYTNNCTMGLQYISWTGTE